jgi:hypothetical protein
MHLKSIQTRGGHTSPDAMIIPLLRALVMTGDANKNIVFEKMRDLVYLTEKDLVVNEAGRPYYYRGLNHMVKRMRDAGLLQPPSGDNWLRITPAGRILAGYE